MHRLIVMGVAGCGKSTLAAGLALALGCDMVEGDDLHPPASRDKMRKGTPLDDADREPWLDRLAAALAERPGPVVATCSALKHRYRECLRAQVRGLRFVFVDIDQADAERRVASRTAHLFPAGLVASQFADLESPLGEPGVLCVAAAWRPQAQLDAALAWLARAPVSDPTHHAGTESP